MNNKTAIITLLYNNYNYGCYLQAYALQMTLCKLGIDNQLIFLNRFPLCGKKNLFNSMKHSIKCFINYKQRRMDIAIKKKKRAFHSFEKNLIIFPKVFDDRNIFELNNYFNCFLCGSDQVWSPVSGTQSTFLSFVSAKKKKISYAASIGADEVSVEYKNYMKKMLKGFDSCSVRETGAKKIIDSILPQKKCRVDLDPTFLLNVDEWNDVCGKKLVNGKYILIYFLGEDDCEWKKAIEYAEKINIRIINIPYNKMKYNVRDYMSQYSIDDIGPSEFLELINGAQYVFTDSFHGLVFSIIFGVKYKYFRREIENVNGSMNGRIDSLLEILELPYDTIETGWDTTKVQNIIHKRREDAKEYLLQNLNS